VLDADQRADAADEAVADPQAPDAVGGRAGLAAKRRQRLLRPVDRAGERIDAGGDRDRAAVVERRVGREAPAGLKQADQAAETGAAAVARRQIDLGAIGTDQRHVQRRRLPVEQ
jgi:hypothetical protein